MAAIDVTDQTFETDVIAKSNEVPVVVDLWADWCGPCKTLGPVIERVVDATDGKVVLVKIDIEANPALSRAFQVQSIPAVYAFRDGQVVNGFMGAQPEQAVKEFVDSLIPTEKEVAVTELIAAGDEDSLRTALSMEPANEDAIAALAELLNGIAAAINALLQHVEKTVEENETLKEQADRLKAITSLVRGR